jgi:hypothetical protein
MTDSQTKQAHSRGASEAVEKEGEILFYIPD